MNTPSPSYLLLIDPYVERVEMIPFTDSITALSRLTGGRFLDCQPLEAGNGDAFLLASDALANEPFPPTWSLVGSDFIYAGRGILIHLSEEGGVSTPHMDPLALFHKIEWFGFTDPDELKTPLSFDFSERDEDKVPDEDGD
ncbi:MAG: hypothetical protein LH609_20255 [Rudanella sp.]|nr:hypothetical protein [Rudanella sp.]